MKTVVSVAVLMSLTNSAFAQSQGRVVIKAGKIHEKCLAPTPLQKIEYGFESSAKVDSVSIITRVIRSIILLSSTALTQNRVFAE